MGSESSHSEYSPLTESDDRLEKEESRENIRDELERVRLNCQTLQQIPLPWDNITLYRPWGIGYTLNAYDINQHSQRKIIRDGHIVGYHLILEYNGHGPFCVKVGQECSTLDKVKREETYPTRIGWEKLIRSLQSKFGCFNDSD